MPANWDEGAAGAAWGRVLGSPPAADANAIAPQVGRIGKRSAAADAEGGEQAPQSGGDKVKKGTELTTHQAGTLQAKADYLDLLSNNDGIRARRLADALAARGGANERFYHVIQCLGGKNEGLRDAFAKLTPEGLDSKLKSALSDAQAHYCLDVLDHGKPSLCQRVYLAAGRVTGTRCDDEEVLSLFLGNSDREVSAGEALEAWTLTQPTLRDSMRHSYYGFLESHLLRRKFFQRGEDARAAAQAAAANAAAPNAAAPNAAAPNAAAPNAAAPNAAAPNAAAPNAAAPNAAAPNAAAWWQANPFVTDESRNSEVGSVASTMAVGGALAAGNAAPASAPTAAPAAPETKRSPVELVALDHEAAALVRVCKDVIGHDREKMGKKFVAWSQHLDEEARGYLLRDDAKEYKTAQAAAPQQRSLFLQELDRAIIEIPKLDKQVIFTAVDASYILDIVRYNKLDDAFYREIDQGSRPAVGSKARTKRDEARREENAIAGELIAWFDHAVASKCDKNYKWKAVQERFAELPEEHKQWFLRHQLSPAAQKLWDEPALPHADRLALRESAITRLDARLCEMGIEGDTGLQTGGDKTRRLICESFRYGASEEAGNAHGTVQRLKKLGKDGVPGDPKDVRDRGGKLAVRLCRKLRGEELAHVRADQDLLQQLKDRSTPKYWQKLQRILGIGDQTDEQDGVTGSVDLDVLSAQKAQPANHQAFAAAPFFPEELSTGDKLKNQARAIPQGFRDARASAGEKLDEAGAALGEAGDDLKAAGKTIAGAPGAIAHTIQDKLRHKDPVFDRRDPGGAGSMVATGHAGHEPPGKLDVAKRGLKKAGGKLRGIGRKVGGKLGIVDAPESEPEARVRTNAPESAYTAHAGALDGQLASNVDVKMRASLLGDPTNARVRGEAAFDLGTAQQHAIDEAELLPSHWSELLISALKKTHESRTEVNSLVNRAFTAGRRREMLTRSAPYKTSGTRVFSTMDAQTFVRNVDAGITGAAREKLEDSRFHNARIALQLGSRIVFEDVFADAKYSRNKLMKTSGFSANFTAITSSYEDLGGLELLEEWSNIGDLRDLKQLRDSHAPDADDYQRLDFEMQQFILDIRRSKIPYLFASMPPDKVVKVENGVRKKLIHAAATDAQAQIALKRAGFSNDKLSHLRTKDLIALDEQKLKSTGAQYNTLAGKTGRIGIKDHTLIGANAASAETKESTAGILGAARRGNAQLARAHQRNAGADAAAAAPAGQAAAVGAPANVPAAALNAPQAAGNAQAEPDVTRDDVAKDKKAAHKEHGARAEKFAIMQGKYNKIVEGFAKALVWAVGAAALATVTALTGGLGGALAVAIITAKVVVSGIVMSQVRKALQGDAFNAEKAFWDVVIKSIITAGAASIGAFAAPELLEMLGHAILDNAETAVDESAGRGVDELLYKPTHFAETTNVAEAAERTGITMMKKGSKSLLATLVGRLRDTDQRPPQAAALIAEMAGIIAMVGAKVGVAVHRENNEALQADPNASQPTKVASNTASGPLGVASRVPMIAGKAIGAAMIPSDTQHGDDRAAGAELLYNGALESLEAALQLCATTQTSNQRRLTLEVVRLQRKRAELLAARASYDLAMKDKGKASDPEKLNKHTDGMMNLALEVLHYMESFAATMEHITPRAMAPSVAGIGENMGQRAAPTAQLRYASFQNQAPPAAWNAGVPQPGAAAANGAAGPIAAADPALAAAVQNQAADAKNGP